MRPIAPAKFTNDNAGALAAASVAHLRPRFGIALVHVAGSVLALCGGVAVAALPGPLAYGIGQSLLTLVFVHAFVTLHEAGHNTLFRSRRANRWVGYAAGFIALIPFRAWTQIHARHHRYTGWQDLDATTASLAPRPIARWERAVIDFAWRTWLPLFSVLYRWQNYWNLRRLRAFLDRPGSVRGIKVNIMVQLLAYAGLLAAVGPTTLAVLVGPALILSLMAEDLLLLSQHTHIPQRLSGGEPVRPFRPMEQAIFTRSLRLPDWLSAILMHFDAHELHHMYPQLPGYTLRRVAYRPPNEVDWIDWVRAAKRLTGTEFLFSNRNDTGAPL
ncbi:MAG: fatty acid desaturase [Burkholderiales bacterium]|nr:fatty acid desaturase [Burkholderiales bacterium]